MTKAYWIANVTVIDKARYAEYQALASKALSAYGARFIARGGKNIALEGRDTPARTIIIEFSNYQQALDCYHSQAYQQAKEARQNAAETDIVIVEGIDD